MRKIKYIFLSFLVLLCAINGNCQIITGAEYFINSDPGIGNGIPLNDIIGINSVNAGLAISINGVRPGFNQLFIRIKDENNNWSIAEQRTFYIDNTLNAISPLLTAAEYFVDSDPGVGNGAPFTIQSGDSASGLTNIPTANLSGGFHQLFIRTKDENNNWSIAEQRTFYIDNTLSYIDSAINHGRVPLIAAEYYIDTNDLGIGKNTPIPVIKGDTVEAAYVYNVPDLAPGVHIMNLRVEDSTGHWSIVESRPFTVGGSVPVTLNSFLLNCNNNKVLLSWRTATEINTSNFEIQKCNDGLHWDIIGLLSAAGNSTVIKKYQFTDEHVAGISLYRLRQVDKDGKSTYSEVLKSNCTFSEVQMQVYPIPSKNEMNVFIHSKNNCNTLIILIDAHGNIIRKINKILVSGNNTISLNIKDIPSGGYFLKIEGLDGLNTQKVIISH